MKISTKNVAITAIGIALFVVLSLCLQVPVFENYYLCLGYVVMTVYCYTIGTISGTIVGTFGVVLYCMLISGLRGMPGWAIGNLFLGIILGIVFKFIKKINKSFWEFLLSSIIVIVATAIAMLVIKSGVESILYAQPIWLRVLKNVYAFVADAFIIIASIPICKFLHPKLNKIIEK